MLTFLNRVSGQSNPPYILLFLGYNVHGHKNIEGIVHSSANVLVVNGLHTHTHTLQMYMILGN